MKSGNMVTPPPLNEGIKNGNLLSIRVWIVPALIVAGLGTAASLRADLFHLLAEIFVAVLAVAQFALAWQMRRLSADRLFLLLACGFLFSGMLAAIHVLTVSGLPLLAGAGGALTGRLWDAIRGY